MNNALAMMTMLAMGGEAIYRNPDIHNPREFVPPNEPIKKRIPNGCKEYWFFDSGSFWHTEPNATYRWVFYCIASNDKTAIKKFNKWKTGESK